MPKSSDVIHRTNVTDTELTDSPDDRGSRQWAERRGQRNDEENAAQPEQQPEAQQ